MSDNEDESGPNLELLDDRVPEIDRDRGPIRRAAPVRMVRSAIGDDLDADVRDVGPDSAGKVVRATKTKGAGGFMFFMTFFMFLMFIFLMPQLFWLKIAGARSANLFQEQLSNLSPSAPLLGAGVTEFNLFPTMAASSGAADPDIHQTSGDTYQKNKENRPHAFIRRSVERRTEHGHVIHNAHDKLPSIPIDPPKDQTVFPIHSFLFR